jgi:transposase InsO family protein
MSVKRLLVDNGAAFPSKAIAAAYKALGVQLKFARSNQPQG